MLDINFVREKPEAVKKNLKKRYQEDKIEWIDDLLKNDKLWKKYKAESDALRAKRNKLSLEMNQLKKQGKKADQQKKKQLSCHNNLKM